MTENRPQCLPLKRDIIYGPVHSRRLGASLGINLSPVRRKICSFNCAYCHYGWSSIVTMDNADYHQEYPKPKSVVRVLRDYLINNPPPDYITFSGNGEPTTHPQFARIVPEVLNIRDETAPEVKVTVLSNSTTAGDPAVREALRQLDIRFMKLDCGDEETYKLFNRPAAGISLTGIIDSLARMDMPIVIQSMFAQGDGGNVNENSLDGYVEAIGRIKPESVQLYSLDRPTPDGTLRGWPQEQLADLANRIDNETGTEVHLFGRRTASSEQ